MANLTIAVKDIDTTLNFSIPAHQLEQVFFILVQNAVDSANITNKDQKLTISCHRGTNEVELIFSNTPSEIEPEKLQDIFEPFLTAAPGATKTDMGLAVAKRIICDHGGDITAESQPRQGLIFHVTLPIKQA